MIGKNKFENKLKLNIFIYFLWWSLILCKWLPIGNEIKAKPALCLNIVKIISCLDEGDKKRVD